VDYKRLRYKNPEKSSAIFEEFFKFPLQFLPLKLIPQLSIFSTLYKIVALLKNARVLSFRKVCGGYLIG